MGRGIKFINILIMLEVIVLILVLVLSGVTNAASGVLSFSSSSSEEAEASGDGSDTGADENSITDEGSAGSGDTSSDDADENAVTSVEVSDTYEEDRLAFNDDVEELLTTLTTGQLAAQLFVTTPEELTGVDGVTVAGEGTETALTTYPVSGLVYSAENFSGTTATRHLLEGTAEYAKEITGTGILLMVEELGGDTASPLADANDLDAADSPASLAQDGDADAVTEEAAARAAYLANVSFNTVLGPYAVTYDEGDDTISDVVYGTADDDAETVSALVTADITAMTEGGILTVVRAFPGVSSSAADYAVFEAAIETGTAILSVGHVTDSALTGDDETPCSLSAGTTTYLRDTLGYTGILMTEDLADEAVTEDYDIGEAAVKAVQAGMNLIYVSDGFEEAYDAVLEAIESGEITQTMLENAVGRILTQTLAL